MTAIQSLTARVEKLERRNRIWAGLCLLSLAAAPLLAAAGSEKRVEAGGFVLRDVRGQRRAALVTTADGATALSLRDTKGVERISLAVAPDGRPSLTVSDASSHPRVRIALARESSLNFYDRRGKLRAVLGVSEYGPRWAPPRAIETAPESRATPESEAARAFFQEGLAAKPVESKPDVLEEAAQMGPVLKLFDVFGTPSLEARVDVDRPVLMLQTRAGAFQALTAERPPVGQQARARRHPSSP
jgi:hypothetical protein